MSETRNSITDIWGERSHYYGNWSAPVEERTLEKPGEWLQSACLLCK